MRRRIRVRPRPSTFILVVSCLLVCAPCSQAQEPEAAEPQSGIGGSVRDAGGAPVVGATIRVVGLEGQAPPAPRVTQTAEDGTFRVEGLEGEPFTVRVESPGHAPFSAWEVEAGASLEVTLEAGHPIAGRILDTEGEPVAGASLRAWDEGAFPFGEPACLRATTDEEGRFRIEHAPIGTVALRAGAKDRATQVLRLEIPAGGEIEPVELRLAAGAPVSGRVVDPEGLPLDGVRVVAFPMNRRLMSESAAWPEQTDAEGRFLFPGVPAGAHDIRATHPDFKPQKTAPFEVGAGESPDEIEIVLHAPARLTLRLVGDDDEPVDRFDLYLRRGGGPSIGLVLTQVPQHAIEAGEDGRFTVGDLDPGTFDLVFVPAGYAEIERSAVPLRAGRELDLGTLVVERGLTIRGSVSDPEGRPIPGAAVRTVHADLTGRKRETRSREDGRYELGGLEEIPVSLRATAEGRAPLVRHDVMPGDSAVDFVLQPNGSITGKVELADGTVPDAFHITAHRAPVGFEAGWVEEMRSTADHAFSGGDGSFRLEDVAPARYVLEVRADGKAPLRKPGVEVAAGEPVDVGTLVLKDGITVRGRALAAADETPLPGVRVIVLAPTGALPTYGGTVTAEAGTDAHGEFRLTGLTPGLHSVEAVHADFAPLVVDLELEPDVEPQELLLRLTQGGTLRGHVRDGQGQPVTDGRVVVFDDRLGGADGRSAYTGSDGSYEVELLRPGSYQAMLIRGGREEVKARTAVIRQGEATVLDFDLAARIRLAGTVSQGDEALPQATLFFQPDVYSAKLLTTESDGAGRYEIGLDEPGSYLVTVRRGSGGSGSVRLTVPDEPQVERDILLVPGSIAGVVSDETGRPVVGASVSARSEPPDEESSAGNARTDTGGRYRMDGLTEGAYRVVASAPGYEVGILRGVDVSGSNVVADVNFTLSTGLTVRGRVIDAHGQGLGGALVLAAPVDLGAEATTSTQTDVDGAFQFTAPGSGPLNVTAIAGGWAPVRISGVMPQTSPDEQGWLLEARRGGSVRVRVADAEGHPQPAIQVRVEAVPAYLGSDLALMFSPPLPTNGEGESVIEALAPGVYEILIPGRGDIPPVRVAVGQGGESFAELRLPSALE